MTKTTKDNRISVLLDYQKQNAPATPQKNKAA